MLMLPNEVGRLWEGGCSSEELMLKMRNKGLVGNILNIKAFGNILNIEAYLAVF